MLTLKKLKTTHVMINLHFYVPSKGTCMTNKLYWRMRKYFNTIGKNYYWWGTKHGDYGFEEWRFFWWRSISMNVHLRIFHIYIFRYQENSHPENSHPENFHQSNSPLVNSPLENSHPEDSHPFFKYSHASFLIFFSLLSPLSLMLLKRLFCNSMFYECWSLYVSENLSKRSVKWRRQLMKWVGMFQVRIFLGGNFPGAKGFSRGEFYGLEFFEWDFPRGGFP